MSEPKYVYKQQMKNIMRILGCMYIYISLKPHIEYRSIKAKHTTLVPQSMNINISMNSVGCKKLATNITYTFLECKLCIHLFNQSGFKLFT
jgi:Ca2+-dependent lipid-binding protein